ncbi:MAG TPA: CinA family nicotinamide mononucleotide deamidase-related protein [Flavitalea sp.]|nr:CinA family nicotinamide mononucleotide deamidase-related protein [Flavitalea sp.]
MSEIVPVSIITIGDELMIGQVVDTNSAWIAKELNASGFWVRKRVSVGDDHDEIWQALDEESSKSKIVLITGGLGPTADDITKPLLCEYFGTRLVVNQDVLNYLEKLFTETFRRPFTERNRKQAEVPETCIVIHNARGTAPGMWFERDGVIFVSMPGVPHEMKAMISTSVIPMLLEKVVTGIILHRTLLTWGIGESFLADTIQDWETALASRLKLAYLPSFGMVRLRITGTGTDKASLEKELDEEFEKLKVIVKEWLVTDRDENLPEVVSRLLKTAGTTLGLAESCTGGFVSHLLTREAGSSEIFKGSVISYSNEVKNQLLNVDDVVLREEGAVSEATVRAMAEGALDVLHTDYAIAISGIMGPGGGSPEKPVGLVWLAAGNKEELITERVQFRYDRLRNIEMASNAALNLLRRFLGKTNNLVG